MKIVSIKTKYISEPNGFMKLINPEFLEPFRPYYETEIAYIAPRDGERPDRVYTVTGRGGTEYQSHEAAIRNLIGEFASDVRCAEAKYMVSIGAGNLDIA
jgi:hypothetical protein